MWPYSPGTSPRKKALQADLDENRRKLAETNRMLQLVIDTMPLSIFWMDRDLKYIGCNHHYAKDAGFKEPSELTGLDDTVLWKKNREQIIKDNLEIISSGISRLDYEESYPGKNGWTRWLNTSKVPLTDTEGNVIGLLGIYQDISERKKTEKALKESEERHRNLFQNNRAVMYVIDPENGDILDANPAASRFYGYSIEQLKTMNISEINTDSIESLKKDMQKAQNNQWYHFTFQHRLASGEIRQVELYGSPLSINGKIYLHSIVHDITDRKKAEEDRERLIRELQKALAEIKTLSGMLPICASCKKIRDDRGYWNQIESYIRDHSQAEFTHSICPECAKKLYPELLEGPKNK